MKHICTKHEDSCTADTKHFRTHNAKHQNNNTPEHVDTTRTQNNEMISNVWAALCAREVPVTAHSEALCDQEPPSPPRPHDKLWEQRLRTKGPVCGKNIGAWVCVGLLSKTYTVCSINCIVSQNQSHQAPPNKCGKNIDAWGCVGSVVENARSARRSTAPCPVVPQHQLYQAPIKSGKDISVWGAACGSPVENMQSLLNQLHCLKSTPPGRTNAAKTSARRGRLRACCRKHNTVCSINCTVSQNPAKHFRNGTTTRRAAACSTVWEQ